MCTSFKFKNFFCRNFDYEQSYKEELIHLPKENNPFLTEYDIIGIGTGIVTDYPLFYDAMNTMGLCVAGLSFPKNAVYNPKIKSMLNIPSYDIPLYILSNCKNISEVKDLLVNMNITNESYEGLPSSELHWLISDKDTSIVLESTKEGISVYDNAFEVLTNNPPFHLMRKNINFNLGLIGAYYNVGDEYYSRGENTNGLSGGYDSIDRFERIVFLKENIIESNVDDDGVLQSFKLLQSVEQINGITDVGDDYEYTIYSVVYDMVDLKVYVKTYNDFNIQEYSLNNTRKKI